MSQVLPDLSQQLAMLQAENARLKAAISSKGSGLRVSEKGAVSMYGYGRWPITVYAKALLNILERAVELRAFIETNRSQLSWKE